MKSKTNTKVNTVVSSADELDLGPLGIALCSVKLGSWLFEHKFILCKNFLCAVIFDLFSPYWSAI